MWRRDASVMLRVMAISDIIAMWIILSVIVRVTDTVDGPCLAEVIMVKHS